MTLILPNPAPVYQQEQENRRNQALKQADQQNHKRNSDVEVGWGHSLILTAADGTRYAVQVDNSGTPALTLTAL